MVLRVLKDTMASKVIKEQQELVNQGFKVGRVFKDSQETAVVVDHRVLLVMKVE
jgi:hypothetical protein